MINSATQTRVAGGPRVTWLVAGLLLGGALGVGAMYATRGSPATSDAAGGESRGQSGGPGRAEREPGLVELSRDKWEAAGIEVAPARRGRLTLTRRVTGKLVPNEDRLAHIFSVVDGTVHEVRVRFGQRVGKGGVLAVIDSKEVGQTKLDLVKARLGVRIAQVNLDWQQTISKNTRALIEALDKGIGPQEIPERFRDQPMGTYREKLVSAYAKMDQTRAQYERTKSLSQRGSVSQQVYEQAKADYEAAQATLNALKEQSKFTIEQELIQAQQALEQAQVTEGTSRAALYILGYGAEQVDRMDALAQKEEVSHYTITAPFDGTIIRKDITLEERVGPGATSSLFELADLSTVWVQADIFEKDLPSLKILPDRTIQFRSSAYPDQRFKAEVFYTGEVVDPKTRTVGMTAAADNPERLLKPGMFVDIELPVGEAKDVLRVAESAIQTDEGRSFVFVYKGGMKFVRRGVTVGRKGEDDAEITAGLKDGEQIAVQGAFTLKSELNREQIGEGD